MARTARRPTAGRLALRRSARRVWAAGAGTAANESVIGSSATGPVRWSSTAGPMAGIGAVIGPASGTATRPVSRADRPGADSGASSSAPPRSSWSGSTHAGAAGPGSTTAGLDPESAMAGGAASGQVPRVGATTPGRSVTGGAVDGRATAGAVAVQNPESGLSDAAGGVLGGVDQPVPRRRGRGEQLARDPRDRARHVRRADHRDAAGRLGDVFGLDDRQLTGGRVGRRVLGEPAATRVGDHALRPRHHRLERGPLRRRREVGGVLHLRAPYQSAYGSVSVAPTITPTRARAARRRARAETSTTVSLTLVGPGRGSESRSRRPGGGWFWGSAPEPS